MITTIKQKGLDNANWKDIRVEQGLGNSVMVWQGEDLVHIHSTKLKEVSEAIHTEPMIRSDSSKVITNMQREIDRLKDENIQARALMVEFIERANKSEVLYPDMYHKFNKLIKLDQEDTGELNKWCTRCQQYSIPDTDSGCSMSQHKDCARYNDETEK